MPDLDQLKAIITALADLNPVDIIKGIENAFHALPPDRWDHVSINGAQVGPVTDHKLGLLLPSSAWASWAWTTTATKAASTLRVDASAGTKDVKVTVDGAVVDNAGRLQVLPIVQGVPGIDAKLKISVRVSCTVGGKATTYRFDGTVWP